jgi:hypothetical protein
MVEAERPIVSRMQALETSVARLGTRIARSIDMSRVRHRFAVSVLAAVVGLGCADLSAQGADAKPLNPPRTQNDLNHERRAACRDLRGPEFRECIANYVGTPDPPRDPQAIPGAPEDKPRKPAAPVPQPQDDPPGTGDPGTK